MRLALVLLAACGANGSAIDAAADDARLVDAAPADAGRCDEAAKPLPNSSSLVEEPGTGGCAAGMVRIDTFCIDRFEASLEGVSPYWNPGATPPRARSLRDAVPQAYITQTEAGAACASAGKRLCTDAEWRRACGGPTNTTYPYGNTRMPGVCNDHRDVHPAVEYFGTTDPSIYSMLGNACLDQLHDTLDRAGANPGCVTVEGVYDMMGNLHEWTANPAGTFRGGFFVDTTLNGDGCNYATTAHDVSYWDYSTGFRCCSD